MTSRALPRPRGRWHNEPKPTPLWALGLASGVLLAGCQKEDHPPYAPACETDCKPTPNISIGSAPGGSTPAPPAADGGFDAGTLTGNVLALNDDTFGHATAFSQPATVSADGATGTPVSGTWNGTNPFALSGVAVVETNWLSVTPSNVQGDALPTLQAVQTNATDTADLYVVDTAVIDGVLTAVSATRAPALGQVVLFFRNAGTGAALSGLQAVMKASEAPAYAAASGWVSPDDTTVTSASGLVVFGNVEPPPAGGSTQTLSVTRLATATTPAASGGQFSVKVVEGAVTVATIPVQL